MVTIGGGDELVRKTVKGIRMRKGIHFQWNGVFHIRCLDAEDRNYRAQHAIMTIHSVDGDRFTTFVTKYPTLFFCDKCDKFIFETVEFMNDVHMQVPTEGRFSNCKK